MRPVGGGGGVGGGRRWSVSTFINSLVPASQLALTIRRGISALVTDVELLTKRSSVPVFGMADPVKEEGRKEKI